MSVIMTGAEHQDLGVDSELAFNNIIHQKMSQPGAIIEGEAQKTIDESSLNSGTESIEREETNMRSEKEQPEKLNENAPHL